MFAGDITDEPAVGMMGSVGVGILGVAICSVLDTYCLAADTPSAILQAPDIVALGYSTKSARAATVGTTISSGAQLAIDFRCFLRRFLVAVNKHVGHAPLRNRIKRLLREGLRHQRERLRDSHDICLFVTQTPKYPLQYNYVSRLITKLIVELNHQSTPAGVESVPTCGS